FNPLPHTVVFRLPSPPHNTGWVKYIDTAARPPHDQCEPGQGVSLRYQPTCHLDGRSLVVLVAET
ncbi:MAG: hypothetical protein RLZZ226_367, partial [Pseudomonadota bacterium]